MGATRLTIIAGKGGVGRTTVAAGLARQRARSGRTVLAIDAAGGRGLGLALGATEPLPAGEMETLAEVGLTALVLDTEAALDEYVRLNLHAPISPRILRPVARVFEYVATAAPAVREILAIGKIAEEVRRERWDDVIVDAPATGHLIELLRAPDELAPVVGGSGPLARDTAWITDLLTDPTVTGVVAVTTAEDLPVAETIELLDRLADETDVAVDRVVINRWPPPVSAAGRAEAAGPLGSPQLERIARAAVARADEAARGQAGLEALGVEISTIAESPDPVGAAEAEAARW